MNLQTLLEQYGYLAIFVGTVLEGETILVLGAVAAHMGYLELPWVISAAMAGTFFGDQVYYFLGRRHGEWVMRRLARWQPRLERVKRLLNRNPVLIIFSFRFLYGFRTITPVIIGMSRFAVLPFVVLNLLAALLWSVVIGLLGYSFGALIQRLLGDMRHYELIAISVVVAAGALVWLVYLWRRRGRH